MQPTAVKLDRNITAFINVGHVVDHLFMLLFPTALLGMGASFGHSYGELLALATGGFIAFGAGSLPAGWLGDRWSRRNMLAVFFIGIGCATLLTGLSTSVWMLATGLTLIGCFASIYHPVGTAMLTAHVHRVGRAIGLNGVFGNLGIAFSALIAGGLTQWLGWRYAFILPGAAAVIIGVAFLLRVPDEPAVKRVRRAAALVISRAILWRAFAVLTLAAVCGGLISNAAMVSMPKLFAERFAPIGASPLGVGAVVFGVYLIASVSQLIVGHIVDRHAIKTVFIPLATLVTLCLLLGIHADNWLLFVLAAGLMFGVFGLVTVNDTIVAKYTGNEWRARAYALRYLVGFSASAAAVPLVAVLHTHSQDFVLMFEVLVVFSVLILFGALAFPHRHEEVAVTATPPAGMPSPE